MDLFSALLSLGIPVVFVVFGIFLFSALFFDKIFDSTFLPDRRLWSTGAGICLIIIGVILFLLGRSTEPLSNPSRESELVATISALQPTATAQAKIIATISAIQLTATAQAELIKSFSNDSVLQMDSVSRVFAYSGGDTNDTQGIGRISVVYDDKRNRSYKLDYSLPDKGSSYSGIAFQFDNTVNLTAYESVEITIEFSEGADCDFKIEDDNNNIDPVYFRIGGGIRPGTGMTIAEQENKQRVIKIPIKGNLDKVNLTRVTEISLVVSSNFNTGKHSFTVSNIRFTN